MDARQKLSRWLEIQGLSQAKAAQEMDTAQSTISKWISGKAVPRWTVMVRLEKWTQGFVRVTDWIPSEDRYAEPMHEKAEAA